MNRKKKVKCVWTILVTDEGKFYMVNSDGEMVWSPVEEQSRMKMFEFATEHGADEVLHSYDLVKYGT